MFTFTFIFTLKVTILAIDYNGLQFFISEFSLFRTILGNDLLPCAYAIRWRSFKPVLG